MILFFPSLDLASSCGACVDPRFLQGCCPRCSTGRPTSKGQLRRTRVEREQQLASAHTVGQQGEHRPEPSALVGGREAAGRRSEVTVRLHRLAGDLYVLSRCKRYVIRRVRSSRPVLLVSQLDSRF
jgi:hypothetical protein